MCIDGGGMGQSFVVPIPSPLGTYLHCSTINQYSINCAFTAIELTIISIFWFIFRIYLWIKTLSQTQTLRTFSKKCANSIVVIILEYKVDISLILARLGFLYLHRLIDKVKVCNCHLYLMRTLIALKCSLFLIIQALWLSKINNISKQWVMHWIG